MKNEEKAPLGAKRKGRELASRNTVQREDISGTSESFNALQVKFDFREGKKEGRFPNVNKL